MGCAPIISYHYGAENHIELKNLLRKSNALMFLIGAGYGPRVPGACRSDGEAVCGLQSGPLWDDGAGARISTISFVIVGFNIFASSFFTALNDGGVSAAISFLRTFVFKMAAILILPVIFKLDGIWFADVTAEAFAFIISLVFLFAKKKKYHYM